jgi:hypothetical protein
MVVEQRFGSSTSGIEPDFYRKLGYKKRQYQDKNYCRPKRQAALFRQ